MKRRCKLVMREIEVGDVVGRRVVYVYSSQRPEDNVMP
jgi:hypothetical protein